MRGRLMPARGSRVRTASSVSARVAAAQRVEVGFWGVAGERREEVVASELERIGGGAGGLGGEQRHDVDDEPEGEG